MTPSAPASMRASARRWISLSIGLVALLWFGPQLPSHSVDAAPSKPKVVISGVYFDGYLKGNPEPEEAIRLTNTDTKRAADVSGWAISDRYFVMTRRAKSGGRRRWRSGSRGRFKSRRGAKARDVILPPGTSIPPGGSIWVAHKAEAFYRVFGHYPAVEGYDTVGSVTDARVPTGWPFFYASRGVVSLQDAFGQPVDVVCYVRNADKDVLDKSKIPEGHWRGPSVMLKKANTYSWTGQVLARDRDANGRTIPDTNTAKDWNNSFSITQLGVDKSHRVELPGQSFWKFPRLRNVNAEVLATSAPENNFAALKRAFSRARREILINIYKFTNDRLADPLIRALARGVKVVVLMEGSPVGGVEERSRFIARRIERAGGTVYFMRGKRKEKIYRRYRFNHAKYAIIDRRWVIIGSENYGTTGHPVHPSRGNRGWEVHIRSPQLVRWMLKVFREDTDEKRFRDVLRYQKNQQGSKWGPPKPGYRISRRVRRGRYTYRKKPLRVRGRMDLEVVLSPDSSLHETRSLIGAILRCKKEVLVAQNAIPLYWGIKHRRSFRKSPTLPLIALVRAAQKGCRVRVMADSIWYHIRNADPRDNDDSIRILNRIAKKYNLDLQAKLINLSSTHVAKIHTKGIIVDRKEVFVGSINWSENSFKGNREVGILIKHPKVAGYYADLFMRDWIHTRLYRVIVDETRQRIFSSAEPGARTIARATIGDPLDVFGIEGEYYQVRLPKRRIGFLKIKEQVRLMTPFESRYQIGTLGAVVGKVKSFKRRKKLRQLFFGRPYERGLSVVIWERTADKLRKRFKSLKSLVGKTIQIKGRITSYRKSPQIILHNPEDLTVLNDK